MFISSWQQLVQEGVEKDFGSQPRVGSAPGSVRFYIIQWTTLSL